MSDTPTAAELEAALETIQRAAGKRRRFSRRQLDAMSAEQVAEALAVDSSAFDHLEEDSDDE